MRIIISFAALMLSIVFLRLSTGGLGPLDALSGVILGFSSSEIGMLGSAHFFGFFIGCWWAPRLMGAIGHSRGFATFAALGLIGILGHTLSNQPIIWIALRVFSGLSVAGCYSIIEAWIQAKLKNQNRGRSLGAYRLVDMGASLFGQLLISILEPAHYLSYNILALICTAALLPLTLTRAKQPELPNAPKLRPIAAYMLSPLAVFAAIVAGLTGASFRMIGPIYGLQVGLEINQIALFLAAFVLGGAVAQYPIGWLADKFDRRWILIFLSCAAICSSTLTIMISDQGTIAIFLAAFTFGFITFPIYSIASAHANDFAEPKQTVELSAALIFYFAVGAIGSPVLSAKLVELHGPNALFIFIAMAHAILVIVSIARMNVRPTTKVKTRYRYTPRTSFGIAKLIRKR